MPVIVPQNIEPNPTQPLIIINKAIRISRMPVITDIFDFPKKDKIKAKMLTRRTATSKPATRSSGCSEFGMIPFSSLFWLIASFATAAQTVAQRKFGILIQKAIIPNIQGTLDLCCTFVTLTVMLSFSIIDLFSCFVCFNSVCRRLGNKKELQNIISGFCSSKRGKAVFVKEIKMLVHNSWLELNPNS